ncbi:MAG: TetR/AcrR family transcriptional regulator [Acidobacteria bacterium]|nr:TetR/AcrR family transcriptional regulator [Acidobacteriota bacterium]
MPRQRSARAISNDIAIRDAAVRMILRVGVDGLAVRDVAKEAKLTHGALYARFEDVEELLVDVWSGSLLSRAISLYEGVARAVADPSKKSVARVMERLRHPVAEDVAMVKALWTSRRRIVLHEEVESFIYEYLETDTIETSGRLQSRTLCLFSFAILAMTGRFQGSLSDEDLDCFETTILDSLEYPVDDIEPVVFSDPIVRDLADPQGNLQSQLAYHTCLAVGTSGYAGATISRISRRANCSPGAIYKIYPTKEDLVIGSVRINMSAPAMRLATLATILDPGRLAQLLFSAASPLNMARKNFTLEVSMAAAYNEGLRAAVKKQMRDIESVVPLLNGLSDEEVFQLTCTIRFIVYAIMGISYLSTVTKVTDRVSFNQFCEPVRQALLRNLGPSWPKIREQLENLASAARVQSLTPP